MIIFDVTYVSVGSPVLRPGSHGIGGGSPVLGGESDV